jgi:drug/metabolite transporter (DMT)-like permease
VAYLIAVASGLLFGAADFLGGLTSRRVSTLAVVVISQAAGVAVLGVALAVLPAATPSRADLLWGAAAGVAGGGGVALLYRGLAVGTMAVVAPVTASCAVIVPVAVDVISGAVLGGRVAGGIALAILAIVLVSQAPASGHAGGQPRRPYAGLGIAVAAGVVIGFFFLALARTSAEAGLWPLVSARFVSVTLFAVAAVAAGASLRLEPRTLVLALAAGALDMLANALYLIATRGGAFSAVVTLASLYPASTVLLARLVLHERLSRVQWVGVACALAAIALIVAP